MRRIRGTAALKYKRLHPEVELNKYNDPLEEERFDVALEYAEEVAREDPSLLYVEIDD